ncbi:MAG: tetratricopeptide (TPR) repeat protein [Halieaceae bacterium]|jgi:tetratricopeptide (TPR) repeat protein
MNPEPSAATFTAFALAGPVLHPVTATQRAIASGLLAGLLLLGGCASSGERMATDANAADGDIANSEAAANADGSDTPPEPPIPERPIPEASVYPLLLAEFALRRRDFDTALNTYLEQAEILRDPAVSAHATHLAQYLQRESEAYRAVGLWVELEPDNLEANATLATLLARQGRTLEALPHLALVARGGDSARFPLLLNRFKALSPTNQAALDAAVQALLDADFGDNVALLLTHALMADEAGKPELAMARLEPVFALDPYVDQALLLEAKLLLNEGVENPLARIEEALEVDPSRSQLRLQYARLLTRNDMAAARAQFEILATDSPQNADLLFSLALLNHELDDNVAAKAYLGQVLQLGKRKDDAYFFLGQIAISEGESETAIYHFQQVSDGKDLLNATVNIAQLQLAAGRDEALANYMDRLRESYPPRREQLYAVEANVYSERNRDAQALDLLGRAISEFPESDNLRYARSILYERADDIAAAEGELRSIISRAPNNATALNALGYTLANRTERYEEARTLIEKAVRLSPNEPAILDSMGWILYRQGDMQGAAEFLTRAYARFPDPEVAAHLGEVLWVSGNTTGAMNVFRDALRKDPQHAVLNETLDRLGITLQADAEP